MHAFCLSLGLTISPSKTEVVVFNGSSSDTEHVGQHILPRSASFKYLGIVFHESGGMTEALARLLQNGKGAAARLSAKHKALMCDISFPMMGRLFDAVVHPTVMYGCEVWAPACSLALVPQLKDMQDIQLSAVPVNSAGASRPTSFSGSLQKGLGWTAGGPWCLASCAGCRFGVTAACI